MASLRYSQIRATPGNTIRYIADRDKMLSTRVQDVSKVLSYMGEPESAERVYAFARHCSTNPDLAARQMELYRARYYKRRRCQPKEKELLGLHFFLSFSAEDRPDEAVMNEIAKEFCRHPLLRDHASFAAHHFDKDHWHTHFFVSNFSAIGNHRKLCMRRKDYNDLRKYANRLCVEHGLSIIDLPALRYNDPAYSAWIDGVISGGRITVHPEREEHRGSKHQGASTKQIYFKRMKEKEEVNIEEGKLLTAAQLRTKRARQHYCWNFENDLAKAGYLMTDPRTGRQRYHAVRLYDENGRKRSLAELICLLLVAIYWCEKNKNDPSPVTQPRKAIQTAADRRIQTIADSARVARELCIQNIDDVRRHIADTGRQMNAMKQEMARHESSLQRHEEILNAWDTYCNTAPVGEAFRRAYAILAQNQVLTEAAIENLRQRYRFEQQKIVDYDKRIPRLNRRYRALKHLERSMICPEAELEQLRKKLAGTQEETLEDQIRAAERTKVQQIQRSHREYGR